MAEHIAADVKRIVADVLGIERVRDVRQEHRLAEDLGADSLDSAELVMVIEQKYQLQVTDETAQRLKTVGDVIAHVKTLLNSSASTRTNNLSTKGK